MDEREYFKRTKAYRKRLETIGKERKPRKRKEVTLTNAECQKRYREKQKALGLKRKATWEEDAGASTEFKTVKVKIHRENYKICESSGYLEKKITLSFGVFLELCEDNNIPRSIVEDVTEFFKVLGVDIPRYDDNLRKAEEDNNRILKALGK